MKKYLSAEHDERKSFNQKALVIETKLYLKLESYGKVVAILNKEKNTLKLNGYFSQTTARHIKEFALQNGFPMPKKSQMENEEILTK